METWSLILILPYKSKTQSIQWKGVRGAAKTRYIENGLIFSHLRFYHFSAVQTFQTHAREGYSRLQGSL